jgi:CRP-like cAMP-binding protein
MNERAQVALVARAALAAGNPASAAAAWRRLVHDEPAHPAWRLRLADALAAAGDEPAARALRLELAEGALAADRPLYGLVAALAASLDDLPERLSGWLGAAEPAGPPPRPAPTAEDAPLADVAPDAPLPAYPVSSAGNRRSPLPLLSLLDADALAALAPGLARRPLAAGEVLLAEGDRADALYLVAAGSLEVVRADEARGEVVLGRVGEGTILGEMALVLERPRSATVRAVTEAETVRIDLNTLRAAAAAHPAVGRALSEFAQRRLLHTLVATSPLFRDLDPGAQSAVLRRFELREAPEGFVLIEQGQPNDRLALLAEGRVEVLRAEGGEAACRVAVLGPGEVFGEIALLTGGAATATVIALEDLRYLELDAAGLDAVGRAYPELRARLEQLGLDRLAENRFIFADDEFFENPD